MALVNTKGGVPRRGPDGMLFYIVPASGSEIKKLARVIAKIDYLRDAKGAIIFNQNGAAVPNFDTDEDQTVAEALKRCPRIDQVKEGQLDEDGKIINETLVIDPVAAEQGLPAGTVKDPAVIRGILELAVSVERKVPIEPPADAIDEIKSYETGADGKPTKPTTRTVKFTQLIAEWLLGEAADIGLAHLKEQQKNS